jgi:hypothetical protein
MQSAVCRSLQAARRNREDRGTFPAASTTIVCTVMIARLVGIAALALLVSFSAAAHADGELPSILAAADKAKLAAFEANKATALKQARANGAPEDVRILDAALAGKPMSLSGSFDATGKWRCRTMKLGGGLPLVVYPRFRCEITDDGAGWFLKKLTGSQRTQGRFYTASDTRLVYVGAGTVNDDPPRKYGDDPNENQVAIVERLARNRLVLQFPDPYYESDFDIMVLER